MNNKLPDDTVIIDFALIYDLKIFLDKFTELLPYAIAKIQEYNDAEMGTD